MCNPQGFPLLIARTLKRKLCTFFVTVTTNFLLHCPY